MRDTPESSLFSACPGYLSLWLARKWRAWFHTASWVNEGGSRELLVYIFLYRLIDFSDLFIFIALNAVCMFLTFVGL